MLLRRVAFPDFCEPCLPSPAAEPPDGAGWLHEIKHDGFRVIARKDGAKVRLYSRPGNDLTYRFPLIVESLARLRPRSCTIDGEAVCCGDDGVPSFDRIRYRRHDASLFLYAFDLIELNGDDLRRDPLEVRKATLANIPGQGRPWHLVQRSRRGRRPDRVQASLQAWSRGHRVETARLALCLRALTALD
jgi:ATP-dependent DNA ligase